MREFKIEPKSKETVLSTLTISEHTSRYISEPDLASNVNRWLRKFIVNDDIITKVKEDKTIQVSLPVGYRLKCNVSPEDDITYILYELTTDWDLIEK